MKLCVIGNSHVGMLAEAARDAPPPGVDLTFFARSGRGPEGVRMRGGRMRAVNPDFRRALAKMGMPEVLEIASFDAFVLVGMTATVFSLLPMLQTHRVFGWPAETEDLERPLVSEAALEAELRAAIAGNLAADLLAKIRRASTAPVLLVPQPAPSEAVLYDGARHVGLRRIHRRQQGRVVMACLAHAHATALHDAGLRVVAQPPETLAHDFLTAAHFMRGAGRLNPGGRQPEDDILHANGTYGELVLSQVIAEVRKTLAESASNRV